MSLIADSAGGMARLQIRSVANGATQLIALRGELEHAGCSQVEDELLRAEANGAEWIVVDLSGVEFIDSSGIALLVAAFRRSSEDRNQLRLIPSHSPDVCRVLEICGLRQALPFVESQGAS